MNQDATITTDADEASAASDTPKNRIFFLIKLVDGAAVIAERYITPDIRQALLVEQVDARLTGEVITIDKLTEAYPDAVKGAHYWSVMKQQAKTNTALRGPFVVLSTATPSDEELVAWYTKTHGPVGPAPAKASPAKKTSKK